MNWISVKKQVPENIKEIFIKAEDNFSADKTKKLIVLTDMGTVTDNHRLKMQVGEKEWVWFMGYDGEEITHWMLFEEPKQEIEIPHHQTATGLPASTSLDGCPFHYCDKNPYCSGSCRYNKE